jgi:hypothetical protein
MLRLRSSSPSRRSLWILALSVVAISALALRIPTIAEPLGIDQGLFASAARGLSRGMVLYRDVWDQKPPAIFLTYLAAFSALGWKSSSIAWLDLLASAATTAMVFAIARRHCDAVLGALAAALFAVFTMPSWLYRNGGILERSVPEVFIMLAMSVAVWLASGLRERASIFRAAGVGACVGVAMVFKPNTGVYLPVLLAWVYFYQAGTLRDFVRTLVVASAAVFVAPFLIFLWLWPTGALPDTWTALVTFNRFYVSGGFTASGYARAFANAVGLRVKTEPLWIAGAIAAFVVVWDLGRTRRLDPLAGLAVAWGAGAALTIATNGIFLFNTYFIQALAPLALLAVWLLAVAISRTMIHRVAAIAAIALMAVVLWQRHYVSRVAEFVDLDSRALAGTIDQTAYLERFGGYGNDRGYSARANAELAAYLRAHTAPDDWIYFFGINASGVYFLADRRPAARYLRVNEFVPSTFPEPGFDLAAVVDRLLQKRPVYVIFEQLHAASAMGQAVDRLERDPETLRLLASYTLETRIEDFALYRLSH